MCNENKKDKRKILKRTDRVFKACLATCILSGLVTLTACGVAAGKSTSTLTLINQNNNMLVEASLSNEWLDYLSQQHQAIISEKKAGIIDTDTYLDRVSELNSHQYLIDNREVLNDYYEALVDKKIIKKGNQLQNEASEALEFAGVSGGLTFLGMIGSIFAGRKKIKLEKELDAEEFDDCEILY